MINRAARTTIFPLAQRLPPLDRLVAVGEIDPDLKRDLLRRRRAAGANYGWEGNNAGAGRMEIIESDAALPGH